MRCPASSPLAGEDLRDVRRKLEEVRGLVALGREWLVAPGNSWEWLPQIPLSCAPQPVVQHSFSWRRKGARGEVRYGGLAGSGGALLDMARYGQNNPWTEPEP